MATLLIAAGLVATSFAWGGETFDLTEGWRFAPDPDGTGQDKGWHQPDFDDSSWATIRAGERWEDQGFPGLDGVAWYRARVAVPERGDADRIWLALGGINDAGTVYCNGERVGEFGDDRLNSMAGTPIVVDVTRAIRWGQENTLAIRVLDWGNSGGLTVGPCILTTDRAAPPVVSLIHFVPGFEGQASVVALELASFGLKSDAKVRFSVSVNDGSAENLDAEVATDRRSRTMAVTNLRLTPKPGDRIRLTAQVAYGKETQEAPLELERLYTWPELPAWPGKYRELRVLNNFVTELRSVEAVPEGQQRYDFLNPRDGWVFVRVRGTDKAVARLDDEKEPLVWRKYPETGDLEAMRHLSEGEHSIALDTTQGAQLDVRAVPEIAFCYWPTKAVLTTLPPRDRAFAERFIFPNSNVLLTHNDMTAEEFNSWRAEGRHWINNSSLLGLHDDAAPTADAVYENWATNPATTRPGYVGLIVDEFLNNSVEHYAAWTEGLERLLKHPGFAGKTYYAWVVDTYQHKPGLEFMRRLHELGGRFAWERYLHEEPTEEMAVLAMYEELSAVQDWERLMPGLRERLLYCLGSFTTPWCSLNINPGTNYIPYMDRQFQTLATDPIFFGSRGIFQWAAHYTDDDVLRYAQNLYRHYCIEGNRTPFRDFPYELTHIENPDFTEGLAGWRVDAAGTDTITAGERTGLGRLQGRWADTGDRYALVVRSGERPNRIGQTVKDLEPGRLYSMKFIAADLDNLGDSKEVGLWPELEGVELVSEGSFRYLMPSSFAVDIDGFNRQNRAYTTYVQVMFRPKGTTAELVFSDWKDGQPAGPAGQRIAFNFVEIQPYFE